MTGSSVLGAGESKPGPEFDTDTISPDGWCEGTAGDAAEPVAGTTVASDMMFTRKQSQGWADRATKANRYDREIFINCFLQLNFFGNA